LIRDNLTFLVLDLSSFIHSSLEIQGITLTLDIYRHPNQTTPFFVLDQFISSMLNKYKKVIFTGDFNAHHPWWRCNYEDNARKTLSHL